MPAWSPVKGLPVAFAPCMPGASPTISNFGLSTPNGGTGLAWYSGYFFLFSSKKRLNLGQAVQFRSNSVEIIGILLRCKLLIIIVYTVQFELK
jgi:hypothetical protein